MDRVEDVETKPRLLIPVVAVWKVCKWIYRRIKHGLA
jgi:hypothetical protein